MTKKSLADASQVTVSHLLQAKSKGEKIVSLTAYDASFAKIVDQSSVDLILVGDSLGMVIQGHAHTIPVTMDDIIYHTRAVVAGSQRALIMADMPFLSYTNTAEALKNAARLMKEGGAHMVKLESSAAQTEVIRRLAEEGIPVCAHLGLRPQTVHKLGGYKVQGRDAEAADVMLQEAQAFAEAGADLLLLECVPAELAYRISHSVSVPVIGIGAGPDCDGQILVLYDILAISHGKRPRFSKDYLQQAGSIPAAVDAYVTEVRQQQFPAAEHSFK